MTRLYAKPPLVQVPLTVAQYDRMIDEGILEEGMPIELLDGFLVRKDRSASGEDPMTVGNEHILVVMRLIKLSRELEENGAHLRGQQPISIPPYDEPEPDGAIVLGTEEDYALRKPTAKDILALIEVSDSSLFRDRTTKLRIYAQAGIAQYLIVNLPGKTVERYTQPSPQTGRFDRKEILSPRQTLALPTARTPLKVPVRRLLP